MIIYKKVLQESCENSNDLEASVKERTEELYNEKILKAEKMNLLDF